MKKQYSFGEFVKKQFRSVRDLFRLRHSLKRKFIMVFILIIFVLGAISFGTYYVMDSSEKRLNTMIDASLTVNTVIGEAKNICDATEENDNSSFMSSYMSQAMTNPKSEKSLNFKKKITDSLAKIDDSLELLEKKYVTDDNTKNTLKQTKTIFENFRKDVASSFEKFEKQDTSAASSFEQVIRSGGYLASFTQNVMSGILSESTRQKEVLKRQSELTGKIVVLSILFIAVLSAITAYLFTGRITKTIRQLADTSMDVAEGNLRVNIAQSAAHDEIALLTKSFQSMTENLRRLIQEITVSSQRVSRSSEMLRTGAEQNSKAIDQIAANTQQVSLNASGQSEKSRETVEVIQDVLDSSKKIQRNTDLLLSSSTRASDAANTGNDKMQNLLDQISRIEIKFSDTQNSTEELKGKTKKIGRALEAISRIASQTNLLSLNASIEAARAGVFGKSFAVVAEEIRKLAIGSADAAQEITGILKEIQFQSEQVADSMTLGVNEVKEGTLLAFEARRTFDEIIGKSNEVEEKVRLIMEEINTVTTKIEKVEGISRGISDSANHTYESTCDVAAAIEEQSASLQEILTSSIELSDMAERLEKSVQQFKL